MKMIQIKLPAPPQPRSPLARALDPGYLSNVIAVAGAAFVVMAFLAYDFAADETLSVSPFTAGITVFLAWAIGRELDPDRTQTAYLAMGIALVGVLMLTPSPLFGFGVLIGARLASGTVGLRLGRIDLLVIVGFGAIMGSTALSLAGVAAIVVGTILIDGSSLRSWVTSLAATVAAAIVFMIAAPIPAGESPAPSDLILFSILLGALVLSVPAARPVSRTDLYDRELTVSRVTAARVIAVAAVGLSFVIAGGPGLQAGLAVAGPPVVATAIWNLAMRFWPTADIVQPT